VFRAQAELADTVGLSTVHINRVLQRLRAKNLIELSHRPLVIPDVEALNAFSGFDPNYLQCLPSCLGLGAAAENPCLRGPETAHGSVEVEPRGWIVLLGTNV